MTKIKWKWGQKTELCNLIGIKPQNLNSILNGSCGVSIARAVELEQASKIVLGRRIPWSVWFFMKLPKGGYAKI